MPAYFDRSYLPPATAEFALVSDTHYMLEQDEVEFESRRKHNDRSDHAIELINDLGPPFVVHLGDHVQEYPETAAFEVAVDAATDQLAAINPPVHYAAGNHDVGDKPDPTMPTNWVTEDSLAAYHDRIGRSWHSWHHEEIHYVVLNSQLLNSSLDAAERQRDWAEAELGTATDPVVLFLHLPPFIHRPDESALGHYDAIDRPAREWLLDLIRETSVAHVFAAHTHFEFAHRIGEARYRVVPSPAFTRPGFPEAFSSCPPPERGRDDRPKLGFYLIRWVDGEARLHFVRTGGATAPAAGRRLLTRTTRDLAHSPVGVSVVGALATETPTPAIFPASIPEPIRNDYPTLGCLALGLGHVRLPGDSVDGAGRAAIDRLRRAGATGIGSVLVRADGTSATLDGGDIGAFDEVEVRLPGTPWPSAAVAERLAGLDTSVALSTVSPRQTVAGKQHDRPRIGYAADELAELDERLAAQGVSVDRALCRVDRDADPWTTMTADVPALERIGAIDWRVPATDLTEPELVRRVARAIAATATLDDARVSIEPLRALDRTMDPAPGFIDRRCNPTDAFHALRAFNTMCFAADHRWSADQERSMDGGAVIGLSAPDTDLWLVLPSPGASIPLEELELPSDRLRRAVVLPSARSHASGDGLATIDPLTEPTVIEVESDR